MGCKRSSECEKNMVCEKGECRDNRREKPVSYYEELCKKKGIPTVYELGTKKGQPKTKDALKRCLHQRARPVAKPKAASAAAAVSLPVKCKKSSECKEGYVCDNKKCRPDKRLKDVEYYIEQCKKRGIPVRYEVGEKKGKVKPIAALKRCAQQKERSAKPAAAKARSV